MAAVSIHVVTVAMVTVDSNTGTRIDKNSKTATINQMKNTETSPRVIADTAVPSSANYPTVKQYLELEAAAGYVLNHIDQNMIVTYEAADL